MQGWLHSISHELLLKERGLPEERTTADLLQTNRHGSEQHFSLHTNTDAFQELRKYLRYTWMHSSVLTSLCFAEQYSPATSMGLTASITGRLSLDSMWGVCCGTVPHTLTSKVARSNCCRQILLFLSSLSFSGILKANSSTRVSWLIFLFSAFFITSDFHYTYWSVGDKNKTEQQQQQQNRSHLISRWVLKKKKAFLLISLGEKKACLFFHVAFPFIKLSPILRVLKAVRVSSSFPQSQYVLGIFSKMGLRHSVTFVEVCRI